MNKIMLALCAALLLLSPNLRAEAILTVEDMGDGVFALIGQTGGRLHENYGLNANYGVIDTPEGAILIDSGASSAAAKLLEAEAVRLTGKPVRWVINTGAQDHRWLGNGHFAARGADIIALARTTATQQKLGRGQIEALRGELREQLQDTLPTIAPHPLAGDEAHLTLGGRQLALRYFADAHFAGDVVIWLPKEKLLFAGDHIYVDRLLGILPESNGETWLQAFAQAVALKPRRIVPGHGRPCDVATAQRETGDYLSFIVSGVKPLAADMAGVDAAVDAMKHAPAFRHLKNYDDLHRANVNRAYLRMEAAQ